jgi:hypothetical protein
VVLFALTAAYSGLWWRRFVSDGAKTRMWPLLGRFNALVCIGSIAGVIAWVGYMHTTIILINIDPFQYLAGMSPQESYALYASFARWLSVFYVPYSIEFACLIASKLLLLRHLTSIISRGAQAHGVNAATCVNVPKAFLVIAAAVVLCSFGGMGAYFTASVYHAQIAESFDSAAAACDSSGNNTNASLAFASEGYNLFTKSYTLASIENVFEALALLVTSAAFVVAVAASVSALSRAELVASSALLSAQSRSTVSLNHARRNASAVAIMDDTIHASINQRRRLVAACVVILVTFIVRATFNLFQTVAFFSDPQNPACPPCAPCQR